MALGLATLALAAVLAWSIQRGRPVAAPEVAGAMLPCVSYAPFRRAGHTPFDASRVVTPEQIEEDLRLLASVTRCVRTYGLDHGLDAVPVVARKLGLRVQLGAWIGRDARANADQLQRALALTRTHRDVIDLLIVGNEVLLRREQTPQQLAALIQQVRRGAGVPVTYADVWEFWQRHGDVLAPHVDLVAVHILPYWEDRPVAVDAAVDHVYAIAAQMRDRFAPRPVYVAETGWPAAGRQRGPAVPGTVEQSLFVRQMLARQAQEPLPFNLIEGFDQPWKRALEGAMGGAWGLFDAQGRQRVQLAGPVRDDAAGWVVLVIAGVAACLMVGWSAWNQRHAHDARAQGMWRPRLLTALVAAHGAACLAWHARSLPVWSRTPLEWVLGTSLAVLALAVTWIACQRVAEDAAGRGAGSRMGAVQAWRSGSAGARLSTTLLLLLWFALAVLLIELVFDPRYRPLPWALFAAPALGFAVLAVLGDEAVPDAREERLLAVVIAVAALLVVLREGWSNGEALALAVAALVLGWALWRTHRGAAPADGRTRTSAASTAAGAASAVE